MTNINIINLAVLLVSMEQNYVFLDLILQFLKIY